MSMVNVGKYAIHLGPKCPIIPKPEHLGVYSLAKPPVEVTSAEVSCILATYIGYNHVNVSDSKHSKGLEPKPSIAVESWI